MTPITSTKVFIFARILACWNSSVLGFERQRPRSMSAKPSLLLFACAERGDLAGRAGRCTRRSGKLDKAEHTVSNNGNKEMNDENIIISDADHAQLSSVIASTGKISWRTKFEFRLLENSLKRAQIVASAELPPDVISMNSRADLLDLESGKRMVLTLVLPAAAKMSDGMISVLAPLGTAMLGHRVGDDIEWHVPHGLRRLKVINVFFEPEASLKKAA
jgi:regulator of nucleoside diphosphate kinase